MRLADLPVRAQINGEKPVVIDFGAVWCGPCRFIQPVFERMSEESRSVAFYRIDIDRAPDISQEVGIRSVRGPRLVKMTSEG
jgi:thioredoxin 1